MKKILNEISEKKIGNLSPMLKLAAKILAECLGRIINDECDENEVSDTMNMISNKNKETYSEDQLLNYDQAGKILGFGTTNRKGLKKFLDDNNVSQIKIGNVKVGFPKEKIIKLKNKL